MNFDPDASLLHFTEKRLHSFQRFTGITNFQISKGLLVFCVCENMMWVGILPMIPLMMCIIATWLYGDIKEAERVCPPFCNYIVVKWANSRSFILCFFIIGIVIFFWVTLLFMFPWLLALYISACTPLPPGESTLKKWVKASKDALTGSSEEAAVPQPV